MLHSQVSLAPVLYLKNIHVFPVKSGKYSLENLTDWTNMRAIGIVSRVLGADSICSPLGGPPGR
jgi:hypothetical protein